jgi:hypothetical protein
VKALEQITVVVLLKKNHHLVGLLGANTHPTPQQEEEHRAVVRMPGCTCDEPGETECTPIGHARRFRVVSVLDPSGLRTH